MIIVCGNVVRDAETRLVTNSKGQKTMVTDVRVAENIGYGDNAMTVYYKATLWGDRGAKLAPYLKSGKGVYINAAAVTASPYLTKEGQPAASLELRRITELKLIGKKVPETSDPESEECEAPEFEGEIVSE